MDRDRLETEPDVLGEKRHVDADSLIKGVSGRRLIATHALIVVVLLATAQSYDGSIHALSHWIVLSAYALCSIGLGLAERRERNADDPLLLGQARRGDWLAWASTGLNAVVAVYIEIEHLLAGADFDDAASAVSRLPAFLLLLQTALSMRVAQTILFSGLVTLAWSGAIAMASWRAGLTLGPHVSLAEEISGLLSFVVASLVVIDGIRRLRSALTAALRLEHERTLLARFVPGSVAVRLAREGGLGTIRDRHACLFALDIRGFSALTRERSQREVVRALLDMRALAHAAVSEHGGIVDKYVGDGMLAQFLVGSGRQQAQAALACACTIQKRLADLNARRVDGDLPALDVTIVLHAGEVLAGVFDDGSRAEFTVLGPAMNALARFETRAKAADRALAVSDEVLRLLGPPPYLGTLAATPIGRATAHQTQLFAIEDTGAPGTPIAERPLAGVRGE